jgi:hypothetical protein
MNRAKNPDNEASGEAGCPVAPHVEMDAGYIGGSPFTGVVRVGKSPFLGAPKCSTCRDGELRLSPLFCIGQYQSIDIPLSSCEAPERLLGCKNCWRIELH